MSTSSSYCASTELVTTAISPGHESDPDQEGERGRRALDAKSAKTLGNRRRRRNRQSEHDRHDDHPQIPEQRDDRESGGRADEQSPVTTPPPSRGSRGRAEGSRVDHDVRPHRPPHVTRNLRRVLRSKPRSFLRNLFRRYLGGRHGWTLGRSRVRPAESRPTSETDLAGADECGWSASRRGCLVSVPLDSSPGWRTSSRRCTRRSTWE